MAFVSKVMKTDQFGSLGPSRVDNRSAHGADEYVNIDDLVALSKQIVYYLVA
jgi:acetylornithine deacetylase/succinyl-diaminopimelate desuccinylase-like protein